MEIWAGNLQNLSKKNMKILITGSAGFIGFHLSKELLKLKFHVIGRIILMIIRR